MGGRQPSRWQRLSLGEAVTLQRGKDLPVQERHSGPFPVIGSSGIVGYHSHFGANGPGVLVGRSGSVGLVTWVEDQYWPLNTALWVSDFHGNDPRFIFYLLEFLDLGRFTAGVSVPTLNRNTLHPLEVEVPAVQEQRAIAGVLDAVKTAEEARHRELALERERKSTLMEYLFSHGTHGKGRAVRQTRHGDVPAEWQVVPLDQCAFIQTGVPKGRKLAGVDVLSVPYLRVANVQDGYLDLAEMKSIPIRQSELNRYRLQGGDVVLTEGGDFDKLGRGFIWHDELSPCVHQNHIFAVRPNLKVMSPEFLAYLAQSPYGKSYFLSVAHKTTNLACINKTKLSNFPALIPSPEEQTSIVKLLQDCDAKIAALERETYFISELFGAMLNDLMTGAVSALPLVEEQKVQ